MARIAEEEIERLKHEVSVERLAEARGVQLKRHGADLIGLCPPPPGCDARSSAV
jgi:DNA primase